MKPREYYSRKFVPKDVWKVPFDFVSGNFIWKNWGLSSRTVFGRTLYITFITMLAGALWIRVLHSLFDIDVDYSYLLKTNITFLCAAPFTTFWVVFAFLRAEFGRKYEHIARIHDALADRVHSKNGHISSPTNIDTVVVNWSEDVLLYDMQNHESFRPSFERHLGAIIFILDNMSNTEADSFRNDYPRISVCLANLATTDRLELKAQVPEFSSMQDKRTEAGERLSKIITLFKYAHLETPLSKETTEKLQEIRDTDIDEIISNVVSIKKAG